MNKRLMMSALLAMMLAACSSKAVKDTPTTAAVVDKSSNSTGATASNDSAHTQAMSESESSSSSPLNDPNNILSKRSVYFDFNKDEVKQEYRPLVDAHAKYLLDHPGAKVILQGNTDEAGSREYNLSLGQRRAVAVKKAINLAGVQDKQIETVSFGEEKVTGDAAKDRRTDIVYDKEQ